MDLCYLFLKITLYTYYLFPKIIQFLSLYPEDKPHVDKNGNVCIKIKLTG